MVSSISKLTIFILFAGLAIVSGAEILSDVKLQAQEVEKLEDKHALDEYLKSIDDFLSLFKDKCIKGAETVCGKRPTDDPRKFMSCVIKYLEDNDWQSCLIVRD